MTDLVEWMLHEGSSIILFVIVVALIFLPLFFNPKAVSAFTAKGKVDELAYMINDVCLSGAAGGTRTIKDFALPQEEKAEQITLIQEFITKISGDPDFVLYYEAFPPGEALGWEIYHRDFGYRLFVPYLGPDLDLDAKPADLSNFLNGTKKKALASRTAQEAKEDEETRKELGKKSLVTFFSNIILNGKLDFATGELIGEGKAGLGEWEDMGGKSEMFSFANYAGASNADKTSIKHIACGDNSLCLKTRQGVVSYYLDNCAANGFDFIVLLNKMAVHSSETGSFTAEGGMIPEFYMASPCKGDLTITASETCIDYLKSTLPKTLTTTFRCNDYFEKIPLYSMGANALTQTGEHWRCVYGTNNDGKPSVPEKPDKCIIINIDPKTQKDYCYTKFFAPADWWKEIISFGILSDKPIKDMRYYLPDIKSFLLRPNLMKGVPVFDLIAGWVWP